MVFATSSNALGALAGGHHNTTGTSNALVRSAHEDLARRWLAVA